MNLGEKPAQLATQLEPINVREVVDRRVTPRQMLVTLCLVMVLFFDGYDIQAIAFAAPAIAREWGVSSAAFAPVFAAGFVGLTLGSFALSHLADRYGLKRALILGVIAFIIFTAAMTQARTLEQLLVMRFLAAAGMGGILPVALALNAEFTPRRHHATSLTLCFLGFTGGVSIGGFVAAQMIPHYGWPIMFWIGSVGALPILLAVYLLVPEAPRFLARTPKGRAVLGRFLKSMDPTLSATRPAAVEVHENERLSVLDLFRDGRGSFTIALWSTFFFSLMIVYVLQTWMPLAISGDRGLGEAAVATSLFQISGAVGGILIARMVDRGGLKWVPLMLLVAVPAVAFPAFALDRGALLFVAVICAGFFLIGSQTNLNAMAALLYPAQLRATGIGWAVGVGRIGTMLGVYVFGRVIGDDASASRLFLFSTLIVGVATIPAMLAIRTKSARKRVEVI